MTVLAALPERYRLILCDAWGVLHNGVRLEPGAAERLVQWRSEGRTVILLTNAPRPADVIWQQLGRLRLPADALDAIVSSGEAGIRALRALGAPVGFLGTPHDRDVLEASGLTIASKDTFDDLACIGFEPGRSELSDYMPRLGQWAARKVRLHCLNPDRVVIYGNRRLPCAGLIADAYEALGGEVIWYGKPFEPIYRHALNVAGDPPRDQVLVIGDAVQTDMLGAARMGFDAILVTGGIHAGEPIPENFPGAMKPGWRPIAVVPSLG